MTMLEQQAQQLLADGTAFVTGEPAQKPALTLSFNGLATPPQIIPRRFVGTLVDVIVPPGFSAIVSGPQGMQRVLTTGSYHFWDIPRGPVMVQWVCTSRQRREVGPIEGWSADKWRVTMHVVVDFWVRDPVAIATHQAPLAVLDDAIRSSVMYHFERMTHEALTGYDPELGGIDVPAHAMAERLNHDPALAGLEIVKLHILERVGDIRRIEAATETAVAIAQLEESTRLKRAEDQSAILSMDGQAVRQAAEADLRMAATIAEGREQLAKHDIAAQHFALDARLRVLEAQIQAQVAEIARDEAAWQAEQQHLHGEWQATLEQHQLEHQSDHAIRVLEVQQRFDATHAERAHQAEERRAKHERDLLVLQMRHEQVLVEQRERLESWRASHERSLLLTQQQHTEQLAMISGTTTIASQAAGRIAQLGSVVARRVGDGESADPNAVAGEGLRTLRMLQEQRQRTAPTVTEVSEDATP